ncbi:MAG: hypothetical protein K2P41_14285, partial [Lachnospiraceae bacterium]|nr:hypothetical protein [Lachnospiraceae bacterium]
PNVKEDLQAALDALTNLDETKLSEEQIAARAEMVQKLQDAIAALEPSEDNAPVITLKLVDAKGNAVDTADATLTEVSHKENISQGTTTYNYEFKLDIINALKYDYTHTDTNAARELKDENGKTIAITGTIGCTFDSDENTFKLTGMTKAATFIVKLVEADTVKVSVSDSVVLDVAPTILADGTAWEGTTITLTLKAGMAEQGYTLPQAIKIKEGPKTELVFGKEYTYDRNTGVITLKDSTGGRTLSSAKAITIISPATLADSVSVTLTSTKANVSPMSIKMGTQFSVNPTFQIVPNEGLGYPASVTRITMKDRSGTPSNLTKDVDWTYDAKTGIVTLQGVKSVTGEISIVAGASQPLITGLTVSEKGAVTEDPAGGNEFQYMLVHPTDDATLFATVASDVDGWLKLTPFDVPGGNWNFGRQPTLSIDDNGSYLVVIEVNTTSEKIIRAGYALLDGITSGTPDAPLRMVDAESHLTPTMESGVITLTPDTDEEWVLPAEINSITVGGAALVEGEYSYDEETGKIILNTNKTGDIVIDAVAAKMLVILEDVAANEAGVVSATGVENFTPNDKFVVLTTDSGVVDILTGLKNGLSWEGFVGKLGLTTAGIANKTVTGDSSLTTSAHVGGYVLAVVIENGKVTKAGIGANAFTGLEPAVTVKAALLHDTDETVQDDELNVAGYTAVDNDGVVTITHPGLKSHKNANSAVGYWVGFQVALDDDEDNPSGSGVTWSQVEYKWQGKANASTASLEDLPEEAKGIAFYYNYSTEGENATPNPDTVEVTFKGTNRESDEVVSKTLTYTVNFDVTTVPVATPEP